MSAASLVRNSRRSRLLGQRELGAIAQISQPQLSLIENGKSSPAYATVERLLRSSGHRLVAVPTTREDAASIADSIAEALEDSADDRAYRWFIQLNDNLAAEHGAIRFALAITEPASTGHKRWDSAIAAVVAHHLRDEDLPLPAWVESSTRSLERAWAIGASEYTITPDRDRVPEEFARRGVLIDEDDLLSA